MTVACAIALLAGGALVVAAPAGSLAFTPFVQEDVRLGAGTVGAFGSSVALAAAGTTALVGAPSERAAWVFVRDGPQWKATGTRLIGPATEGPYRGSFGSRVALSAEGNTALVADPDVRNQAGAVSVFARTAEGWERQGELTPGDALGTGDGRGARFGSGVALSVDGGIALIGGYWDHESRGAAWVFVRSGHTWRQQGPKLTIRDTTPDGQLGISVALSGDGSTALVGRTGSVRSRGGAVVFTRRGTRWLQTGSLTPPKAPGTGFIGASVALSANGRVALIGAPGATVDGVVWAYERRGASWARVGRLASNGPPLYANFGNQVALSADGTSALIGGPFANGYVGAAWVFTRSGTTWTQQGEPLTAGRRKTKLDGLFGMSVALSADGLAALIGGPGSLESARPGAAWSFRRG